MSWALAGLIFLACLVTSTLLGDLISEEIRGWLDLAPRGLLRLAATQLDPVQRETIYQDEWLPDLTYLLRGAESRPITRLIRGMAFATGMVISARRIAQHLDHRHVALPTSDSDVVRATMAGTPQPWALRTVVDNKTADFFWVPEVTADGSRVVAFVGQAKYWQGRPMKWPPPDQSGT